MTKKNSSQSQPSDSTEASFRDPAGFMFFDSKGILHRHISSHGAADLTNLHESGLYQQLVEEGLLVNHHFHKNPQKVSPAAQAVITPDVVPFISYPFEWSFSQLKDAALLTLHVQQRALGMGMNLKDASAYNVQFKSGRPLFIDTLSFTTYQPGEPWAAYGQFCRHFLAPLALMSRTDVSLSQLLRVHLDGIPLDLTAKLLPRRARLNPGLLMHIFLHAKMQQSKAGQGKIKTTGQTGPKPVPLQNLQGILASLQRTISRLQPPKTPSEWADYYTVNNNYSKVAASNKAAAVRRLAKDLKATTAIDFGGNDGRYSRVLAAMGISTITADIDPNAVEANYHHVKKEGESRVLPLLIDLTNPGGSLGWANRERAPIHHRLQADMAMALALVHHLAISNHLPLERIARYFSLFAPFLIIEFVPKEDSQVQKLLAARPDIFPNYHRDGFVAAFTHHYKPIRELPIKGTKRTLFLFERS